MSKFDYKLHRVELEHRTTRKPHYVLAWAIDHDDLMMELERVFMTDWKDEFIFIDHEVVATNDDGEVCDE